MNKEEKQHTEERVIRETRGMCPTCLKSLPARVIVKDDGVYLSRNCPDCGRCDTRLSKHAWYYEELDKYFFSVMDGDFKQRDYIIRLTERCNLNCPICLASANANPDNDLKMEDLLKFTDQGRKLKIDLMSAEPTVREDLPEMMRRLKKQGHIIALHTNGIKLADREYLKTLIDAGMDEVHLQLDGFEDKTYEVLRGKPLSKVKMKALENLEEFNIATDLVMVIAPDLNEHEVPAMLEYAKKHPFVRELFFLGLRSLGYARETGHDKCYLPDDTIEIVEQYTNGEIDRKSVQRFQKLYFALLSLLGIRKCLYVQHYLLIRDKKGDFIHAKDLFDWKKVEEHLDRLPGIPRRNVPGRFWWFLGLGWKMLSINTLKVAWDVVKMKLRLLKGFDLSKLSNQTLILGYITACDPFIFDEMLAKYCGKGELATDIGQHESGAVANVTREKYWKEKTDNE
ncbi:MAG: radical SAM protein [Candidatus Eremiobacteraeota bacterium]|nr:radical SAM protein [Candidatus Eremiobacteraeota bacterium]